jgi:hypothetical protein
LSNFLPSGSNPPIVKMSSNNRESPFLQPKLHLNIYLFSYHKQHKTRKRSFYYDCCISLSYNLNREGPWSRALPEEGAPQGGSTAWTHFHLAGPFLLVIPSTKDLTLHKTVNWYDQHWRTWDAYTITHRLFKVSQIWR